MRDSWRGIWVVKYLLGRPLLVAVASSGFIAWPLGTRLVPYSWEGGGLDAAILARQWLWLGAFLGVGSALEALTRLRWLLSRKRGALHTSTMLRIAALGGSLGLGVALLPLLFWSPRLLPDLVRSSLGLIATTSHLAILAVLLVRLNLSRSVGVGSLGVLAWILPATLSSQGGVVGAFASLLDAQAHWALTADESSSLASLSSSILPIGALALILAAASVPRASSDDQLTSVLRRSTQ